VFRPGFVPFLTASQMSLFFSDLGRLSEIIVRFYVLLKEEKKVGAEFAQIERIFMDEREDLGGVFVEDRTTC
jgi:hypothetical protein